MICGCDVLSDLQRFQNSHVARKFVTRYFSLRLLHITLNHGILLIQHPVQRQEASDDVSHIWKTGSSACLQHNETEQLEKWKHFIAILSCTHDMFGMWEPCSSLALWVVLIFDCSTLRSGATVSLPLSICFSLAIRRVKIGSCWVCLANWTCAYWKLDFVNQV